MNKQKLLAEFNERVNLFRDLESSYGTTELNTEILREFRFIAGQQGTWVDKNNTSKVSEDKFGITKSVLHIGKRYADDLQDDFILYHFPETNRPKSRDLGEIEATKNCKKFHIPLYVIAVNKDNPKLRDIHLAFVVDFDDESKLFLIEFWDQELLSTASEVITIDDFELIEQEAETKYVKTKTRTNQQRFKFDVLKRYGSHCAFCDITQSDLLDAAHLYPKSKSGTDDPRNGLPMCPLHHRAYDNGYMTINPNTYKIELVKNISAKELYISHDDIKHLKNKPHIDTLLKVYIENQN